MSIDELLTTRANINTGVAYIFCNYKQQAEQTAVNLISSLVRQLAAQKPSTLKDIESLHNHHSTRKTRPALSEVSKALQSVVSSFDVVHIVVDAMDECYEGGCREAFLGALAALPENTRFVFTSRPNVRTTIFSSIQELDILASKEDIHAYVDSRIVGSRRIARMVESDSALRGNIKDSVVDSAKGMYVCSILNSSKQPQSSLETCKSLDLGFYLFFLLG